jgi:hypothetical protein
MISNDNNMFTSNDPIPPVGSHGPPSLAPPALRTDYDPTNNITPYDQYNQGSLYFEQPVSDEFYRDHCFL